MSTRIHPKNVHKMSLKVSTRCHLFCPWDVTYYVHEMSATHNFVGILGSPNWFCFSSKLILIANCSRHCDTSFYLAKERSYTLNIMQMLTKSNSCIHSPWVKKWRKWQRLSRFLHFPINSFFFQHEYWIGIQILLCIYQIQYPTKPRLWWGQTMGSSDK